MNLSMLQIKTLATSSFSYTRSEFRKSIFSLKQITTDCRRSRYIFLSSYAQFRLEPSQLSELVAYSSLTVHKGPSAPLVSSIQNLHPLRALPLYPAERSRCSAEQVLSTFIPVFVCVSEDIFQPHFV